MSENESAVERLKKIQEEQAAKDTEQRQLEGTELANTQAKEEGYKEPARPEGWQDDDNPQSETTFGVKAGTQEVPSETRPLHDLHFTAGVDLQDVQDLFEMVRNGTLLENRVDALDKAFWLAGGINAYFHTHKEPGVFATIAVPNELEGDGGLVSRIQEELAEQPKGLNPILAALLKQLIKLILEQLL